jgi:hypothetical protein
MQYPPRTDLDLDAYLAHLRRSSDALRRWSKLVVVHEDGPCGVRVLPHEIHNPAGDRPTDIEQLGA